LVSSVTSCLPNVFPIVAHSSQELQQFPECLYRRVEQYFVQWAVEMAKHNRTRAAELLRMAKVDQLHYLMRK
jgi:hypothetical protein